MDFLDKLSKAMDAFTEVFISDMSLTHIVDSYTFEELCKFARQMKKKYPQIKKCLVSVEKKDEIDGKVYPEPKFVVRVVMLDGNDQPLVTDRKDEYIGSYTVASTIDGQLKKISENGTKTLLLSQMEEN